MTRKFKALGLAIVAMAAMSMAAASGVQAAELHATHNGNVTVTGQQNVEFKFQITHEQGGPSTNCKKVTFEGTQPYVSGTQVTAQEATQTLTIAECSSFGVNAQILMNGCKLTVTNKSSQGVTTAKTAYVDIAGCTTGKQIEVITPVCIITVPEQNHLQHIVFSNTEEAGKPHHTHANITITGITYQVHRKSAFCSHNQDTVTRSDAQLTGQATFRSYKDTGTQQVTEHGHQFNKSNHLNEQVGVLAT